MYKSYNSESKFMFKKIAFISMFDIHNVVNEISRQISNNNDYGY